MPHFPSVFVGAIVSGTSLILIEKELSHRERLSSKWFLRERTEMELGKLWKSAKASVKNGDKPQDSQMLAGNFMNDAMTQWNSSVEQARKFLSKK